MFTHTTGQGAVSRGTRWWRSKEAGKHSWGFTEEDKNIQLSHCNQNPSDRDICLHTSTDGLGGGYQCGPNKNLVPGSGGSKWEKIVFEN